MKFSTMKQAAQFRINENDIDYWIEDYWKAAIKIFTSNVNETIMFFRQECTDEEFYWLSEIFEEIAEKTQSSELIQVWRTRLSAVSPEKYNQTNFKSDHMRKWVDYNEYVREVGEEIDYATGRIRESTVP